MDWVVQCDFDGTISLNDVADTLLERFGLPGWEHLEQEWENGIIGSSDCMRGQVALLDMTREQLDSHLDTIEVIPNFRRLSLQPVVWDGQFISSVMVWTMQLAQSWPAMA